MSTSPGNRPRKEAAMDRSRPAAPTMGATETREHDMSVIERSPLAEPDRHRGRGRAVIAACAVVTVGAVAGVALLVTGGKDQPAAARPSSPPAVANSDPVPVVTSAPTPEDLAAQDAEARYGAFIGVTDRVAQGGYRNVQLYDTVAISHARIQLLLEAQRAGTDRVTGRVTIASLTIQAVTLPADPGRTYPSVRLLACLDVSKVDVVDARGRSVVAPGRLNRIKSEVLLQKIPPGAFTADRKRSGWFVAEVKQPGQPC